MAGAHIQFRADPELLQKLDTAANDMGFTRSQAVRYLLARALGDSDEQAAAKQVVWGINAKLQRNMDSFTREVYQLVLKYLGGTFTLEDSEDAGGPTVEPEPTVSGLRKRRRR